MVWAADARTDSITNGPVTAAVTVTAKLCPLVNETPREKDGWLRGWFAKQLKWICFFPGSRRGTEREALRCTLRGSREGGSLAKRDHIEEGEGSDSVWRPTRVPSKVLGVVGRKMTATGADERGGSSCHREVKVG